MASPSQVYRHGSLSKQTWNVTSRRNEKAIFCDYPCPPAESKLKDAEINGQKSKAPSAPFFSPSFPPFYRLSNTTVAASPAPCSPAREDCWLPSREELGALLMHLLLLEEPGLRPWRMLSWWVSGLFLAILPSSCSGCMLARDISSTAPGFLFSLP